MGSRVCVIGAGIAGLVTAKVLRDDGFNVVVFEKLPTIGGVWAPRNTYRGLRTNSPRETYAFSDFPYLATADDFPTAEQVRDYLDGYVEHFELAPLLRLATEVCSVSRAPRSADRASSPFELTLRRRNGRARETRVSCDFVAVCNGVFSQPYVPPIEGRERFAGRVLHSSEMTDPFALIGQRIVVVGAGKSALDCATWAARHCRSCTLVYRAPHWMVPRYFYGHIRADRVIMTRFFELFTRYHSPNRFESFLHGPARGIVRLWWRAQTALLRRSLGVPSSLVPDHPLPSGFENVGIGFEFYDVLRRGRLATKRGGIAKFVGPRRSCWTLARWWKRTWSCSRPAGVSASTFSIPNCTTKCRKAASSICIATFFRRASLASGSSATHPRLRVSSRRRSRLTGYRNASAVNCSCQPFPRWNARSTASTRGQRTSFPHARKAISSVHSSATTSTS
jgi:thioredoxin reductase